MNRRRGRTEMDSLKHWLWLATSDKVVFPIMEGIFLLFVLFAIFKDLRRRWQQRPGGVSLGITRGQPALRGFYFVYLSIAFVMVLVPLNVNILKEHRTFFTLANISMLVDLLFFTGWFRNKMVGWWAKVEKVEQIKAKK